MEGPSMEELLAQDSHDEPDVAEVEEVAHE